MRVITGTARGRRLITRDGQDVRPTTDLVKEAVFSMIQFEIEGRRFLDLFAGSGQMGIEALSRGAEQAVFVDSAAASVQVIRQNLAAVGFEDRAQVVSADAVNFLSSRPGEFDLIYLDPPYSSGWLGKILPLAAKVLREGGVMLCEHAKEEQPPESLGEDVKLAKTSRYGKCCVSVYRRGDAE